MALLTCMLAFASCSLAGQAPPQQRPTAVPRPALAVPLGAAVNYNALINDARYRDLLRATFSMVVPENEMKFDAIEPEQGQFNFQRADAIVTFAEDNNMWVRGHTLVWEQQLPAWLTNGHFTRDELMRILKEHILTEVGHFRGRVKTWDVVNEALAGTGLRDDLWLRVIGPDYIKWAFIWAHEADPQAQLYYNDYADQDGPKADALYTLVTNLRSQGVPIAGVGLEMHVDARQPPDAQAVAATMRRFAAAGFQVAITEMDVMLQHLTGSLQSQYQTQAAIYRAFALDCRQAPNCKFFTTWGVCDQYSWIIAATHHADAPLLFDKNYQPKPALYAVTGAL
ncbi:MAG: endo-1,4-beta-xylanase [Ktedonobacterales bacterium]